VTNRASTVAPARAGLPTQVVVRSPLPRPAGTRPGFRPDVEGLRAVAVVLVVLGHAGVPGFAGGYVGVDVFFVISGFLITTLLVKEARTTGRVSILGFYARRAVRLLPAAALVLMVTVAGAWLWLSPIRVREFAVDALASAFSVGNVRFAVTGTDYLNADATPSPFQHFWSLGVEEQFYLVWPLLIVVMGWAATRTGTGHRLRWTAGALAVITVASFWLSVSETERSAPWAYFGAHTRAWELGVGAMVALGVGYLARLSGPVAAVLGWLGLLAVIGSAVGFDGATAYPGAVALLPVLGTAAIIVAGVNAPRHGVPALLGEGRLQIVGRLSYSWYLWHWPVLMIGPAALGIKAGVAANLLLCAGAFGLAAGTYHLVENPIRHRRILRDEPLRGLRLGLALCCLVGLVAAVAALRPPAVPVGATAPDLRATVAAAADPAAVLADFIARGARTRQLPSNLTPTLDQANIEKPKVYDGGCHVESAVVTVQAACVYGDRAAPTTVVLFGDSHAAQWFPALERLATQRHWKLVNLTKSSCPAADMLVWHVTLKRAYTECQIWRVAAFKELGRLKPALVVAANSFNYEPALRDGDLTAQWTAAWTRTDDVLLRTGARVATIADTPYIWVRVPTCLAQRSTQITRCNRTTTSVLRGPEQRAALAKLAPRNGTTLVDPVPWMCADVCPAVLGNTLVYRDSNHLTTVFTTAVLPLLAEALPDIR
jgi:peptidoglycan/LPS O-acetylase OafA/YrhL